MAEPINARTVQADHLARQADPVRAGPCPVCRGRQFWRSIYGVTRCATCYPPAAEDLVAERLELAPSQTRPGAAACG